MEQRISRVFSLVWMAASLLWVILWIALPVIGWRLVGAFGESTGEALSGFSEQLGALESLVNQSDTLIGSVTEILDDTASAADSVSLVLLQSQPVFNQSTDVIIQDLPDALDGIKDAMPNVIEAARLIDNTLTFLSGVGFVIPVPFSSDINLDLGVDYQPQVPIDQALENLGANIEGIPETMRDMEDDMAQISHTLQLTSSEITIVAADIRTASEQVSEITPELINLASTLPVVQSQITNIQEGLPGAARAVQWGLVGISLLSILLTLPQFVFSWMWYRGRLPTNSDHLS